MAYFMSIHQTIPPEVQSIVNTNTMNFMAFILSSLHDRSRYSPLQRRNSFELNKFYEVSVVKKFSLIFKPEAYDREGLITQPDDILRHRKVTRDGNFTSTGYSYTLHKMVYPSRSYDTLVPFRRSVVR